MGFFVLRALDGKAEDEVFTVRLLMEEP